MDFRNLGPRARPGERLRGALKSGRNGAAMRRDGGFVAPAAHNGLPGIEGQLEVTRRLHLHAGDAVEIGKPGTVDSGEVEPRKLGLRRSQRSPHQLAGAVGKAIFDVIAGRTDPDDLARLDPDAARAVAQPDRL